VGLRQRAKSVGRAVVDRVARPYVNEIRDAVVSASTTHRIEVDSTVGLAPGNVPSDFFHNLLHELRTIELERTPYAGPRALSVGASGTWYFEWFERHYGVVEHHIGIEAFEPEPPDLQSNVHWIPAPADRFDGVDDGTVDVVFAGQTTEHLWANELLGFLLESHRVLRPGGLLALDSPNRLVTEHLLWSHGGHTIELSPDEMAELLRLAGFDPLPARGAWTCRRGDERFALEEGLDDPALLARRIALGGDSADDSFIWWINAARAERTPHAADLRDQIQSLFERHWPRRVCRGMADPIATTVHISTAAPAVSTLPFPLPRGTWELEIEQLGATGSDPVQVGARILAPGGEVLHVLDGASATTAGKIARWTFDRPDLVFACTMEVTLQGAGTGVDLRFPFALRPAGRLFDFDVSTG
jgi:SAM-dependent methyltransferase